MGENVFFLGLVSLFTDLSSEMIYPLLPLFFTGLVPPALAAIYIGLFWASIGPMGAFSIGAGLALAAALAMFLLGSRPRRETGSDCTI